MVDFKIYKKDPLSIGLRMQVWSIPEGPGH